MNPLPRPRRGGFTLVEMLVVLAIIGILAALIIPAVWQAVLSAREARIILEVSQLNDAVERYRQTHGAYPPDRFNSPAIVPHMRRAFPKHEEGAGAGTPLGQLVYPNLTPAEALVFWLGQIINDPRHPISSLAEPDVIYPFVETRLRPTRTVTLGTRLVQLYEYLPPDGGLAPYVYFPAPYTVTDTATGNLVVDHFAFDSDGDAVADLNVYPYLSNRPMSAGEVNPALSPPPAVQLQWCNPTTFQIISAGLDGEYGVDTSPINGGSGYKIFPDGVNYSEQDFDNIANFSNNKTFDDNIE